ncbi:hemagluttinin domain-containing protein [Stenotrophomonas maltophilia]|uniref:ESPR-type extended signal peptide-containing protein n=1 Tax=Stenotrophomonas maltophilia TaxID=40324 RepID=UPI0015DF7DCE|nr:ESPR-type extended signal peptide-containing protein [Stenotrophomonas maltophilia]MBA0343581.1 hemagluttinin domain-containing protein [Stenotrophomonas maltophilia]MBA0520529.1 hemagluttinin domain-containing protein [Stenotrophomonas maltophilia]
MNKIYRRIWSLAKQCWVVASEFSTPRGKASQSVGAAALAVALTFVAPCALADATDTEEKSFDWSRVSARSFLSGTFDAGLIAASSSILYQTVHQSSVTTDSSYRNSTVEGDHMLVLGSRSSLSGDNSVGFGNRIFSSGSHNVAVGVEARVGGGGYGTAVGAKSWADGLGTTALGHNARAYSENSIALGSGAGTNSSKAGISRIAIGGDAYAGTNGWTGAIALGGKARADYDALAIGYEAKATANGAIALGRGSIANEANSVSVGDSSTKRRIVNVADARLSAASTDAVTGKQLHATNQSVATAQNTASEAKTAADQALVNTRLVTQTSASSAIRLGGDNTGTVINVANKNGTKRVVQNIANGVVSATSTDAVTGQQLHATQQTANAASAAATAAQTAATAAKSTADAVNAAVRARALSLGEGALAETNSYGISTALGHNAKAYNGQGVAMGYDALAGVDKDGVKVAGANGGVSIGARTRSGNGAVALGLQANAAADRSVAVGHQSSAQGLYAASLGFQSTASGAQATALGRGSAAAGAQATAVGNQAAASAANATALGDRAVASHAGSVALGNGSQTSAGNQVSVGSASLQRKIVNVADAALSGTSTEAVTGKQLHATNSNVTTAQNTATAAQTTATAAKTSADSALAQATMLGGLVGQVSATGNVRLGAENTGTMLDVRNKANANRKISGVADAALSGTSTEAVTGKQLHATNSNVTTAQNTATAAQTTATAAKTSADSALAQATTLGGLVGQVSATGNVRLGAENTGTVLDVRNKANANRKISGVADAALSGTSTEAVTGKQLHATNSNVTTAQNTATAAQTTATAAKTSADSALAQATTLSGLVGQVSASGNIRLGAENTGTIVDVANKSGAKRRIYNVGNAVLSASSTDAVTGQQLFATNEVARVQGQTMSSHASQLTAHAVRIDGNRDDLDLLRQEFDAFTPDLEGVVKFSEDRSVVEMGGARVTGIADGDISSAASTDAVSGGQLFATNERIGQMEEGRRFLKIGTDEFSEDATAGWFGVAIGESAEASPTNEGGTAVGSFAKALGTNSVALGRAAFVANNATEGFALGASSRVEIDSGVALGGRAEVKAGASNSVALGYGSHATEVDTVSIGNDRLKRRLVNVGRGSSESDATTVAQLNESLSTLGGGAGLDASGNVVAPTYTVQGGTQRTVGDALTVLDSTTTKTGTRVGMVESQLRSMFQGGATTQAGGVGQLTLAGANGMVLTNLADGRLAAGSRDAVTGSQLYAAKQDIARNKSEIEQMKEQQDQRVSSARQGPIDFAGARVTGLAEGDISSAMSSDAVTGGQLYTTNSKLADLEDSQRFLSVGSAGPGVSAKAGLVGVALGDSAVGVGEGAVALGSFSRAGGKNSVALGRAAHVMESAEDGFAVGVRSVVSAEKGIAIGAASAVQSGATYSVAIGSGSIAREALTVSFGEGALQRRLVNIANGRHAHDATTVAQLNDTLRTLGGGAHVDANGTIVGPSFNLQGRAHSTLGDALSALDGAVTSTGSRMDRVEGQLRSVFQDTPGARADGIGQLTLAGAQGMVISNVANGLIAAGSRDAVNGGQLHAMQQQLNGRVDGLESRLDGQPQGRSLNLASADAPASSPAPANEPPAAEVSGTPQVASNEAGSPPTASSKKDDSPSPKPQIDTAELERMLARANEYTDGAISSVERRLDKMDKRFNRMAAMNSAQSAMAMNTAGLATYNRLGAGVGYAEGESAMAVGYQRVLNDKGSATFSLNGAFTNSGERTVGVGVGIGW